MDKIKTFGWILAVTICLVLAGIFVFTVWNKSPSVQISRDGKDIIKNYPISDRVYLDTARDLTYIDTEKSYISAKPETLKHSGWVESEVIIKDYDGKIDAIFQTDTEKVVPTVLQIYDPSIQPYTFIQNCRDYIVKGDLVSCYAENGSLEFEEKFIKQKENDFTIERFSSIEWKDLATFEKIGTNIYVIKNLNLEKLSSYKYRYYIKVDGKVYAKYNLAFIPTDTDTKAYMTKYAPYALDPFINSSGDDQKKNYLNASLISAHSFDQTALPMFDEFRGKYNNTQSVGSPNWGNSTAVIGKSMYLYGDAGAGLFLNESIRNEIASVSADYSFLVWIYWIKSQGDASSQRMFDDGSIQSNINAGTGNIETYYMPANINSNNSVTEKVWTMVTYTCSNGNVFKIYLNNTLVGANSTSTCARWGTTMRIGTEATANRNLGGNMDNLMIFNKSLNQTELDDLYNSGFGIMWNKTGGTVPASINVTLQLPTPYFNSSSQNILFNCSAYELNGLPMINLTLIIDNIDNYTLFNTTVNQNLSIETTQPVTANVQHNYTCRGSTASNSSTASPLKYFTVDTASPVVSLSNVTNIITDKLPKNSSWWFNATDLTLQSCWYYTNENLTNKTVPCNAMKINYSWATEGTKTFYACANDSFSRITCNSSSMEVIYSNYTQTVSLDPATEGSILTFALRVNIAGMQSKWTGSNATLIFNNVAYAPTSTASFDNYTIFTKTISIPMGYGNETGKKYGWNWTYAIANATYTLINANTAVNYSTIYNITMGGCGTGKVEIINLTWKDEETTLMNNGSMELDLNLTNENLTWNYYHTWASNDSVSVCVNENLLNYTSFRIDFVIGYDNLSTYVREFYYLDNGTLDNSSWYNPYTDKTIDLFDLPTADSTTFLFEYTDENNQEVENIIVHTYRYYIGEGLFREVERSRQDNSGQTHVHLVEEDVIYYFMITQGGSILYTSDTYNAKCLATPCEISLSASAVTTNWSIIDNEGGKYRVSTNKASRTVTVAFDLESQSLVNATVWKFSNGTASYINATSLNATSGSLTLSIPYVYDNSTFFVSIFRNNQFVKSEWVDLTESAINYFGTFGAILGGLVVLAIVLMAVSEGAGLIVFSSLALIIIGIMKLVDLGWLAIISLICAGGIIVWKLVSRRNSKQ